MEHISETFLNSILEFQEDLQYKAMQLYKGDESDSDDLVQDTLIKALDNEDKFEKGTNLKGWLLTIMYRIFVNKYRRRKKFGEICDRHKSYTTKVSHRDAYEIDPLDSLQMETVMGILEDNLDNIFFDVLKRIDVLGHSYKETSINLQIPKGTVMSRLYRARRKARGVLLSVYDMEILEKYLDMDNL